MTGDRIVELNIEAWETIKPLNWDRVISTGDIVGVEGYYTTKDSGKREHFESGMQRDTEEGKTKWHLIASGPMLQRWAELMTRGAEKYDDNNWMKADGQEESDRFKASAYRHFMQWYYGATDEDHAAAIFFNVNGAEYVKDKNA